MASSTCTFYRHLSNARACLKNTRALVHIVAAKSFFISTAHGSRRAMWHMSVAEPSYAGLRAIWHAATPESISEAGWGLEPRYAWRHWSPLKQGGEVWSRGTCDNARAHLSRVVWSGAIGCVAVYECLPTACWPGESKLSSRQLSA
jgi:hypothetical protein